MYLNERKIKILDAIISDYIVTAEPIGSRTIAKKYDLGVSSATIRNEMSDLEEMGLIVQPHASAGRVPSDKGYRFYVDTLMGNRELTEEEANFLQGIIINNINHIEYLMRESAKALSLLTNYTTIVSEPKIDRIKIKYLQLMPLDDNHVLLVIVTSSKIVKNQAVKMHNAPDVEALSKISVVLNKKLADKYTSEIDEKMSAELVKELGEYGYVAISVIDSILDLQQEDENVQIYMSGAKNILAFPEFSDLDKARALFHTLEEKDVLITLLDNEGKQDVQIVIGAENDIENMRDCSIIKGSYSVGGHHYGGIGIIGPTRMDYPQVVSALNGIVKTINRVIADLL